MAWVAGADVSTGELITAAQWNNYLGASGSMEYLKTEADKLDDVSDTEPSRAFDTIYENTSGKIRIVIISVALTSSEGASFEIGSSSPPTDEIWRSGNVENECPITAIVPPGYFYRLNDDLGTPTLYQWHEYDLH